MEPLPDSGAGTGPIWQLTISAALGTLLNYRALGTLLNYWNNW